MHRAFDTYLKFVILNIDKLDINPFFVEINTFFSKLNPHIHVNEYVKKCN